MCGRFTASWPSISDLVRALGVSADPEQTVLYRPRWNVAPTDRHWIVRLPEDAGPPRLDPATWGLVPPAHARTSRPGKPLINARSESAARTPAFREAFRDRRCVVPVDGFYEWVGPPQARRPIWFHPAQGEVLRLAGLWEPGADDATFTILTTAANDVVAPAHDRMPVILDPDAIDTWLRGGPDDVRALLQPCPGAWLAARPVVPRANSVKVDDPLCLEPWDPSVEVAAPARATASPRARAARPSATLPLFGEPIGDAATRRRGRSA
jgi:putative SOS response-associated peptidase YedK